MMRDVEEPRESRPTLPDWGQAGAPALGPGARAWRLTAAFGLVPVIVLFLIPLGVPALIVGVVLVVYAATALWWVTSQGKRALAEAGAREPRPGELARLENLVTGLAADLGVDAPALLVADADGPNAMVAKTSRPTIVVTTALVEQFNRTELEAALAHCLIRIVSGGAAAAQAGLAMGPLGAGFGGSVGKADDIVTAAVTRYPPALVSAIEKCSPHRGGRAALWFVAESPSHVPATERIAALVDL